MFERWSPDELDTAQLADKHCQNVRCLEEARSLMLSTMMELGAARQPVGYKDLTPDSCGNR